MLCTLLVTIWLYTVSPCASFAHVCSSLCTAAFLKLLHNSFSSSSWFVTLCLNPEILSKLKSLALPAISLLTLLRWLRLDIFERFMLKFYRFYWQAIDWLRELFKHVFMVLVCSICWWRSLSFYSSRCSSNTMYWSFCLWLWSTWCWSWASLCINMAMNCWFWVFCCWSCCWINAVSMFSVEPG